MMRRRSRAQPCSGLASWRPWPRRLQPSWRSSTRSRAVCSGSIQLKVKDQQGSEVQIIELKVEDQQGSEVQASMVNGVDPDVVDDKVLIVLVLPLFVRGCEGRLRGYLRFADPVRRAQLEWGGYLRL